jgi:predicted lactoylglutathione lyase
MNQVYIGLPVKDLHASTLFYKEIGFEQDMRFTGETMAQFKVSDTIYISLFPMAGFIENIPLEDLDTDSYKGVTIALSVNAREDVDALVTSASEAGGQVFIEANDQPFMYMNGFKDLDGHIWTIFSMKM